MPVAQLDRASDSDSEGRAFESHRAYFNSPKLQTNLGDIFKRKLHVKNRKKFLISGICFIAFWAIVLACCILYINKSKTENSGDIPFNENETEINGEVLPEEVSEPPVFIENEAPSLPEDPSESEKPTEPEKYAYLPGAVDLRWYLPEAQFDILFASEDNITGRALYPAVPLLEKTTAAMLKRAYDRFLEDGYIVKIYDAYRPLSAQTALWRAVNNKKYIADPSLGGSWHQGGKAIDMSLIDAKTGEELEMPTPMHTFSDKAGRYANNGWSEEATKNVNYMTSVMKSFGFNTIRTEWWHFERNVKDATSLDPEIDFDSLQYVSADELNALENS